MKCVMNCSVNVFRCVAVALALLGTHAAQAASSSCFLATPSNLTQAYIPGSASPVAITASVSFTCTNTSNSADALYYELGVSSAQATGTTYQALNGSSSMTYALNQVSVSGPAWGDTSGTRFSSGSTPVTLAGKSTTTFNMNFYLVIPPAQTVAAGTYQDTLTLKLYNGPTASPGLKDSRTFSLGISVAASCALSSPPGDVLFQYTSFQPNAAQASTSFGVTCVSGTPYTLSLDSTSGTLLGLSYTLSLTPGGTRTGTGLAQNATIIGVMPGGQAGTCSAATCSTSEPRTLTISY